MRVFLYIHVYLFFKFVHSFFFISYKNVRFRDDKEKAGEMDGWLSRMHSVVVGPGLGSDEQALNTAEVRLEDTLKL